MFRTLLRFSGIAGIAVLWLSVGISLLVTGLDVFAQRPISYLGIYDSSKHSFNSGLIVAAMLLLAFLCSLSQRFRLTKPFIISFVVLQLSQIVVALTPFNATNIARPIHVIAGFTLAVMLPLSMELFTHTPDISDEVRATTRGFFRVELVLFVLGIGWFVLASRGGALAEIVTAIGFDVWIVWLSLRCLKPMERLVTN